MIKKMNEEVFSGFSCSWIRLYVVPVRAFTSQPSPADRSSSGVSTSRYIFGNQWRGVSISKNTHRDKNPNNNDPSFVVGFI